MLYDWFPYHFFASIEPKVYLISGFFVILSFVFLREKAGKPMPNALMKKYSRTPLLLVILWALRASIIFLSVMILALIFVPREYTPHTIPREAYVVALDISKSMETDDISPSRIEYAKSLLIEKIQDLPASGLIIFAGKTFVLSPLTTDIT
jgi:Ca-activated chloride channel family protein